jgi:uncharacterized protein (DUF2141 family)
MRPDVLRDDLHVTPSHRISRHSMPLRRMPLRPRQDLVNLCHSSNRKRQPENTMTRTIRTALLILTTAGAPLAQSADLTIRIDNVRTASGQVMVALYDSAGSFLRQPVRSQGVPAGAGSTTVVFRDLAPGRYGITVYHDANGNGKMDSNMMGIPVEPFGFGKDAQGHMGPPSFDDAALALPPAGLATHVTLR